MLGRRRWLVAASMGALGPSIPARADIPRLARIRKRAQPRVRALFSDAGVAYPPRRMLLRAFKHDADFEVWASAGGVGPLVLIQRYPICKKSGVLGPKRRWGDLQVPEGFYHIHRFNAWSAYHMSLRVDYPNASDRVRGKKGALGGAIMVHGDCVTIGCIPLQDDPIEEVFIAVLDTHRKGREKVPIHIYPTRMHDDGMRLLRERAAGDETRMAFWNELRPAYRHFAATKTIPTIEIDRDTGAYTVTDPDPSVG